MYFSPPGAAVHNDIWRKSWKVALAPSNYPHGCQLAVLFTKKKYKVSNFFTLFDFFNKTKEALKYYFAVKKQFDKPTNDKGRIQHCDAMAFCTSL